MANHDYVIANQNGANTRSDLNNALSAIVSNNSSVTAPSTTYAFMWWADTANDILKQRNAADSAWISILTLSTGAPLGGIGSTIQAYDVDTAKLDADQYWTGSQRSADVVDNDGSFDLNAGQNFTCTPTGNITLTFTNIPDGQSGTIVMINSGGHTISAAATTKVMGVDMLTTITTAGTYVIGYISDGTNVRVYNSGAQQ